MPDDLNVVNDTQENTGDSQIEVNSDVSDNAEVDSSKSSEVADPKPAQDKPTNDNYAAARREAESQAKALKDRQDNFAKQYGYNTFEELEYAQQVRDYANQNNVDPAIAEIKVQQDKLVQQIALQGHQTRIQQEKASLQNQRFFKDLEPEIDATLRANPSLGVRDVFDYIKGKRMDDLLKKETAAAKQKTMNDINGKSHIRSDGGSVDNDSVDVDPEEFKVAKALNPKETLESYRAWKKSQK